MALATILLVFSVWVVATEPIVECREGFSVVVDGDRTFNEVDPETHDYVRCGG